MSVPVLPLRLFRHRTYSALLTGGFFFQAAAILRSGHAKPALLTGAGLLIAGLGTGPAMGGITPRGRGPAPAPASRAGVRAAPGEPAAGSTGR
ncbi:hypothetical protein ABZ370_10205 [Streptomyces sp. NPDC005962]|uniref:hypothetical protein n=1 Tax=Streptomyces sp. NPDC005962 TaxID=3154466 RepID=UPI0034035239